MKVSIDYAISTFIHKIMNLPPHQINTTNDTNTETGRKSLLFSFTIQRLVILN